jgi:hypothetical protein
MTDSTTPAIESKQLGTALVVLTTWPEAGGKITVTYQGEREAFPVHFMYAGNAKERFDALKSSKDAIQMVVDDTLGGILEL